jgi:hypothetical protein
MGKPSITAATVTASIPDAERNINMNQRRLHNVRDRSETDGRGVSERDRGVS